MHIAGIQNNSFVDYPGKVAMVIFAGGCSWNCYYCHNRDIISPSSQGVLYSPDFLMKDLEARKKFLDGIVIGGGEPTLQEGLGDFLRRIRGVCDLPIKLDTNGIQPDVLIDLAKAKLVDFIAMDVKAPKEKYSQIVGLPIEIEEIDRAIKVVKVSGVDYEFRTTFCPELTQSDIVRLVDWISEEGRVARYALQQYVKQGAMHKDAHTKEYVQETFNKIRSRFGVAVLRGL